MNKLHLQSLGVKVIVWSTFISAPVLYQILVLLFVPTAVVEFCTTGLWLEVLRTIALSRKFRKNSFS